MLRFKFLEFICVVIFKTILKIPSDKLNLTVLKTYDEIDAVVFNTLKTNYKLNLQPNNFSPTVHFLHFCKYFKRL